MEDILSAVWRGVQDEWHRDPESLQYLEDLKAGGERSRRTEQRLLKAARRRLVDGWGHRMGFELRYRRSAIEVYTARRCEFCNEIFSSGNLHERYCCADHREEARKVRRQAERRRRGIGWRYYWLNPRSPLDYKKRIWRDWRSRRFHFHRDPIASLTGGDDELVEVALAGYKLPEPSAERMPVEVEEELAAAEFF